MGIAINVKCAIHPDHLSSNYLNIDMPPCFSLSKPE